MARLGDELRNPRQFLRDVISWLIINSMRVDGVQFSLLGEQNANNIWRKRAFTKLQLGRAALDAQDCPPDLSRSLQVFRERVDFAIETSVPVPQKYSLKISSMIQANR